MAYDQNAGHFYVLHDPTAQKPGARFFLWLHTLHEAHLVSPAPAGVVWKLLVLICGLSLVFFPVSGLIMWIMRRSKRKA